VNSFLNTSPDRGRALAPLQKTDSGAHPGWAAWSELFPPSGRQHGAGIHPGSLRECVRGRPHALPEGREGVCSVRCCGGAGALGPLVRATGGFAPGPSRVNCSAVGCIWTSLRRFLCRKTYAGISPGSTGWVARRHIGSSGNERQRHSFMFFL